MSLIFNMARSMEQRPGHVNLQSLLQQRIQSLRRERGKAHYRHIAVFVECKDVDFVVSQA